MTTELRFRGYKGRYDVYAGVGVRDSGVWVWVGVVEYDDYYQFGGVGWAAITRSHVGIADPVINAGAPVLRTRRAAALALIGEDMA